MKLLRKTGRGIAWMTLILVTMGITWALGAESWSDSWGTTPAERTMVLPGDDLLDTPATQTTRAVTISARADQVWPWIAQFGQGRGGLYSYDWLERLFGVDMRSANEILAYEQDIEAGDQIWVTQPGYPADLGLVVAEVQPGRALVLAASTPSRPSAPDGSPWIWSFVVESPSADTTRLIVRNRNASVGAVGDAIWDRIVGPVSFPMERATLLGIKLRAERAADVDLGWSGSETVWFVGLLVTGAAVLAAAAAPASTGARAAVVAGTTVAATLVLFRFTHVSLSLALAVVSWLLAVTMWRRRQQVRPAPAPSARASKAKTLVST